MSAAGLIAAAIVLLAASAPALACLRRPLADRAFVAVAAGACALAAVAAATGLTDAAPSAVSVPWNVPGGGLVVRLDPLGAWFALAIAVVGACAAVFSPSYLATASRARFARYAAFFCVLLASLFVVAAAGNALLFLAGWEAMTVSAWFLVTTGHEDAKVRAAGSLYLFANHTAAICILAMVAMLAAGAGSCDFREIAVARPAAGTLAFVLGAAGFGTKAALIPLHIWLPHAHPAAPAPVSALLSGVLVKSGIFGFLRFLPMLPPLPAWAGPAVLAAGAVSCVLGVLYALAQHDVKRLLAYHTIENVGIITIGTGIGIVGARAGMPGVAALGFAGALLHLLNHALFKALLFLGAGAVVRAAGTGEMDRLGGLGRRMPWTAIAFLVGCISICALPPGNGIVSEWPICSAAIRAGFAGTGAERMWGAIAVLVLALSGGLAAACFAKAFGTTFLGEPRSSHGATAREASWSQRAPMVFLAAACLAIGVFPHVAAQAVWPVVRQVAGLAPGAEPVAATPDAWRPVAVTALALLGAGAVVRLARAAAGRRTTGSDPGSATAAAPSSPVPTWGCGYAAGSPRMQTTSASFAGPLLGLFRFLVPVHAEGAAAKGSFPAAPSRTTHTPDTAEHLLFRPAFDALRMLCGAVRAVQRTPVQAQAALVMAALAALLLWKVVL